MKKLSACAIFVFMGFAVPKVSGQETAQMEFKTETIDYGKIEKGSNGLRVFEFTNTGEIPLVITAVKSSCACTVPSKPENPVLPGETGEITVEYDTSIVGPIRKTITIYSNAEDPNKSLKIKGRVVE